MTPILTAEQQEFRDSFRSFLSEHSPIAAARKKLEAEAGSDPALWNKLMEIGVLSYFGESIESGGGTVRDLGLLAAEAGSGVLSENLIEAALISYLCSSRITKEERTALQNRFGDTLLSGLADGSARVSLAISSADFTAVDQPQGKGERISGECRFVADADAASFLLFCELKSDRVFFCDIREKGALRSRADTLDRSQARFTVILNDTPCAALPTLSASTVDQLHRAIAAAELGGTARKALDLTVDYVKTREQFDVPIGGFQAVQHAAADMMVKVEALSALADFACWSFDASADQAKLSALSAALYGAEAAPKVIEKAIQLHGGIGFTWEHDLHLLLRRARTLAALIAPRANTYADLISAADRS